MDLKHIIEQSAKRYPEHTAIVLGDERLTYAELDLKSNKLANALRELGVKPGDRIATMLNNSIEYAICYFGIAKAGATTVPMDTRYKLEEMEAVFSICRPQMLITESPFRDMLAPSLSRFSFLRHVMDISPEPDPNLLNLRDLIAAASDRETAIEINPADTAVITYTSGPSTDPHGAMISHRSLFTDAAMSIGAFRQNEQDVVMLFALPVYHMFGLVTVLICSVMSGSTLVMVPGTGISINTLLSTIEKEKGTILFGVPYIFSLAVKMAKREGINNDLSSLRLCVSGGAPLSPNTVRQFKKYYGFTLLDIWGLTEATSHVTCPPLDRVKIGTAGKPMPGWQLKIVDDNGRDLPANQPGEIVIKGPTMSGYYRNPGATARVMKKGWLHTGDIGILDEEGYVSITGRKKKMIILKGQNVYPVDVEKVLLEHPRIATVKVVGVPDQLRGEIVTAIITPKYGEKITEQEIRHYCQQRMADFKAPKQIILTEAPQPLIARYAAEPVKRYLSRLSYSLSRSPYTGIEQVLRSHPKVAGAKVSSIPDRLRGEMLKAVIRIKEGEMVTEEEIRRFCQEKLANSRFFQKITFKAKS